MAVTPCSCSLCYLRWKYRVILFSRRSFILKREELSYLLKLSKINIFHRFSPCPYIFLSSDFCSRIKFIPYLPFIIIRIIKIKKSEWIRLLLQSLHIIVDIILGGKKLWFLSLVSLFIKLAFLGVLKPWRLRFLCLHGFFVRLIIKESFVVSLHVYSQFVHHGALLIKTITICPYFLNMMMELRRRSVKPVVKIVLDSR